MKLNILTDRYYPDVVGGGEISLAYLVRGLEKKTGMDIRILVQSPWATRISTERNGMVTIVRIPVFHDITIEKTRLKGLEPGRIDTLFEKSRKEKNSFFRWLGKMSLAVKNWFFYLVKNTDISIIDKLSLFISNMISSIFRGENIEYPDADFRFFGDPTPLYDKLRESRCDVIHADNTRSILRYAESGAKLPCVAVFRDLKFICPRRKIIAHTSRGVCNDCRFQCLYDFPAILRPFIKRVFKANISYRRQALKSFTRVVCTSLFLKKSLQRTMDIPVEVIPNPWGFGLPEEKQDKDNAVTKSIKKILFVGMLNPNKGPDTALEILGGLLSQGIEAKLFLAGRGQMESSLKNKARFLQIETHVEFLGFLKKADLAKHYRTAHVVICPTRWPEPFGRVPIEAMAYGVPTVAYGCGGFTETILDGETGYLALPGDFEAFFLRVKKILTDDRLRKAMSEKCREHVMQTFSVEKITDRYLAVYASAIRSAAQN